MTRSAINCESCNFTCRSKPSLQRHKKLVHTRQNKPVEKVTKKEKYQCTLVLMVIQHSQNKTKMKKHVNEEHKNEERLNEQVESSPRKESKKVDLNVRFDVPDKAEVSMEETEVEGKEAKEARTQDKTLSMSRRIFDQNQRLFILQIEKDKLEAANKTIRDKANTDVRELEEYIQEEARVVKEKVKQLEVTIVKQMEVIERQEIEIKKLARDLTKQVVQQGAQEGHGHRFREQWQSRE